jgi:predicted Zn-dependent protease
MKFTPKLADGNVNISTSHPLKEGAWLIAELLIFLALFYVVLGFVSSFVAVHLPVKAEVWLGNKISSGFDVPSSPFLQHHLDQLIEAVPADSPLHDYTFRVRVDESDEMNAFALPGGYIVVLEGLLKTVESENELDMVLAHELGHFAHRDHLQSMGRSLLALVAAGILPGDQSYGAVSWIAGKFERKYSQKQEAAADAWGLDLLNRRYGHVGGATDFFSRLSGEHKSRFAYYFATHPLPDDRVDHLNALIREHGYAMRDTIPLPLEKE